MIQKIDKSRFKGSGPIQILYPGLVVSTNDTGIGSIGRIDHAEVHGNGTIPMHPHVNDEILSYFRSGKGIHKDSEGIVEIIGKSKLMLMRAGKLFYHEETMIDEGEPLEGLQIFIRPSTKDLKPEVTFLDLSTLHSEDEWRLLASPFPATKFQFSSQTWLYDMKLLKDSTAILPELSRSDLTCLLYIYKGKVKANDIIDLEKKESLIIRNETISIKASADSELVLFVTDEDGYIYDGGMYSGNKAKGLNQRLTV